MIRRPLLVVRSPEVFAPQRTDVARISLDLAPSLAWPKNLTLRLGTGVGLAAAFRGRTYEPGAPIRLDAPGRIELDVRLPPVARARRGVVEVCFLLDEVRDACHPLHWEGETGARPKRRLWGVLVGFSEHEAKDLRLSFAQNDALDLADLLLGDHRRRVVERTSSLAPDFDEVHLDVIVSPSTAGARQELESLARSAHVTVRPPTKASIVAALEAIAERGRGQDLSNDLLLFSFSGHGIVHPYNRVVGRTGFVTPQTRQTFDQETVQDTVLDSDELLGLLARIEAEKIIVMDACRTPVGLAELEPFDPGLLQKEFDLRELSAHFFFSASAGQFALEAADYAINKNRPEGARGNGLFSFAWLDALTNPAADLRGAGAVAGRIEVIEVKRHIDVLFDPDDERSPARIVAARSGSALAQRPIHVPARWFANDVVRTLEPAQ